MDVQQILQIGKRCTEEENPPCTEACPLHIDIRTMLKHIQNGSWDSAWRHYQKQAVFPVLLSHLCDAPCRKACVRSDFDGGLELPLIERAICEYAGHQTPRKFKAPARSSSVTIVGAGLVGLTAAVLLAGAGYRIVLYERDSRPGGRLWEMDEAGHSHSLLQTQLDMIIQEQNIDIKCSTEIRSLLECGGDVVILATGSRDQAYRIAAGDGSSDDSEFWLLQNENGVFFAGSDNYNDRLSAVKAIAAGKQIAQRVNWYLQGMKTELQTDVRQNAAKLKPDTSEMKPRNAVRPANDNRYTQEEAREEAGRCLLCRCLRCVNECELLAAGRAYPKKYVNDVYQSLNLVEKFSESICKRQIYSCNLCGHCQTVCPESVDMGSVYQQARRILYEKGSLPPAFHEFYINDMSFSNSEVALELPGKKGNRWLFFPGCRLGAFFPRAVEAAYRLLNERLQEQVALLLGCCGAPAYWAGREDLHSQVIAYIREKYNELGKPEIIVACPSCARLLLQFAPDIPQKMLWELFLDIGIPEQARDLRGLEFTVFDPCAAQHNAALMRSVRDLLQNNGADLVPMKKTGGCCGYGGLISYTNPKLLERIAQRRISQSEADYVTYCVNCRDTFLRRGKPTWHLLELLFPEHDEDRLPSLEAQRENRRKLARRLQGLTGSPDYEAPVLADSAVIEKLDRQLILIEQVYRAITHCEQTGKLIWNEDTGTFFGAYREGAATYWVEYECLGNQYRVVNAYRHHMEIAGSS